MEGAPVQDGVRASVDRWPSVVLLTLVLDSSVGTSPGQSACTDPRSRLFAFPWGQEGSEACPDVTEPGFSRFPVALWSEWKKKVVSFSFFFHLGAEQICYRDVYISMATVLILALPHLMPTWRVPYWVRAQGVGKVSGPVGVKQHGVASGRVLPESKWLAYI